MVFFKVWFYLKGETAVQTATVQAVNSQQARQLVAENREIRAWGKVKVVR